MDDRARVIVVGGGFAGLAAAKALRGAPARVLLIDRRNHHIFQPLLYQVATATLPPEAISVPIRQVLRKQRNATVVMAEVTGVDLERRHLLARSPERGTTALAYDYLVLATGVEQSYFGHDEFARFAPGLKSLPDAQAIRSKLLRAYEAAETEEDPAQHRDLLTMVLVGAGPTGVELAGAIANMARVTLRSNFRRIDPRSTRIVLLDNGPRILAAFGADLAGKAQGRLTSMGVEIRSRAHVDQVDDKGVTVGGDRIPSRTVLWTAGVRPSPAGQWLRAETDHGGRVAVRPDLSVPGRPEVFVVGDTAHLEQKGKPLPGVAQVAMQQGRYVGKLISSRIAGRPPTSAFSYFDKGNMAVIGKNFGILESGKLRLSGFSAWIAWAGIHLAYLPQAQHRGEVLLQWAWAYLTGQQGSRLILDAVPPPPPSASALGQERIA